MFTASLYTEKIKLAAENNRLMTVRHISILERYCVCFDVFQMNSKWSMKCGEHVNQREPF